MITILHGENNVASRNRLIELKNQARKKHFDIYSLDGKNIYFSQLIQLLDTHSLFSQNKLVIIENMISHLAKGKVKDVIFSYLKKGEFNTDLILWEKKPVGIKIKELKKASHVHEEAYNYPKIIFKFVEMLNSKNKEILLSLFHTLIKQNVPTPVVFAMIVRQFRLLLALATNSKISEIKKMASWQQNKLKMQLHYYSLETLIDHYKSLLSIDYRIKTGKTPYDLTKHIEQFIITL